MVVRRRSSERDNRPPYDPRVAESWQSRIVGHGEEAPDQLLANPRNWRIHPRGQRRALELTLDEVGWLRPVIVNQATGHVVDGHLRVSLAIEVEASTVPVAYVELTEDEERAILAVHDPLAELAAIDQGAYETLLAGIGQDELSELLRGLDAQATPSATTVGDGASNGEAKPEGTLELVCPYCTHEFDWKQEADGPMG